MLSEYVPYQDHELEGYLAYPKKAKQPAVILCHAWAGRDAYICEKADLISSWGYAAFAIDVYGKGVLGQSPSENKALKQPFLADRQLLKNRLLRGYEAACAHPFIDNDSFVVLGFGFGGLCALDLARAVPAIKGVISVYGHFEPPIKSAVQPIQSKVLILHGHDDPIDKMEELLQFQKRLSQNKTDWQTNIYSQSMHAFTTPTANNPEMGIAYNPVATERVWKDIRQFVDEVLSFEK